MPNLDLAMTNHHNPIADGWAHKRIAHCQRIHWQRAAPEHKLPRFRYTLRTLLIFTLLASVGMSWIGVKIRRAEKQRRAVEMILRQGGYVKYDYQVRRRFPYNVKTPGPAWLRRFLGDDAFAQVKTVRVHYQFNDADLEHVRGLTGLEELCLSGTKVTDAGLAYLQKSAELRVLWLDSTKVTGAGLDHFRGLTQLKMLNLADSSVTDAGLRQLKTLSQLYSLNLASTQITDAGLAPLKELKQLQILSLRNTQVTEDGVKELQRALPNCEIYR